MKSQRREDVRVMIADSQPEKGQELRAKLRKMGLLNVEVCPDGIQALWNIKKEPYDLVLLDWSTPKLDALGVLRNIRQTPRFRAPKIIVLLNTADRTAIEQAAELGAQDMLVRPFRDSTLKTRVQKLVEVQLL